jgi:cytoskeletal protein RodZ
MKGIGAELKVKREELNYDYDYIFQKTKIHPKVIKALEEEDFEYFSSLLYLKGFLKKYAEFLGLNPQDLLAKLEDEISPQIFERKKSAVVSPSLLSGTEKMLLGLKLLLSIIVVVTSIYLLFFVVDKISDVLHREKKVSLQGSPPVEKPPLKPVSKGEIKLSPLELVIEAREDCWLQLRADGEKIFEGIWRKGSRESWKANSEFELWVGEASRLKLFLNGKDLGPLGRGVIKGIKVTKEGLRLP